MNLKRRFGKYEARASLGEVSHPFRRFFRRRLVVQLWEAVDKPKVRWTLQLNVPRAARMVSHHSFRSVNASFDDWIVGPVALSRTECT